SVDRQAGKWLAKARALTNSPLSSRTQNSPKAKSVTASLSPASSGCSFSAAWASGSWPLVQSSRTSATRSFVDRVLGLKTSTWFILRKPFAQLLHQPVHVADTQVQHPGNFLLSVTVAKHVQQFLLVWEAAPAKRFPALLGTDDLARRGIGRFQVLDSKRSRAVQGFLPVDVPALGQTLPRGIGHLVACDLAQEAQQGCRIGKILGS